MSLLNAWLLKRFKRRPLVMVSTLGMAACMFVSGAVTLWIKQGLIDITLLINFITITKYKCDNYFLKGNENVSWVPVLCLLLYVCASMIGLLTIPWTMTAELFPTEIRGIGHSLSYSMANLLMFLAIQSYRYVVICIILCNKDNFKLNAFFS